MSQTTIGIDNEMKKVEKGDFYGETGNDFEEMYLVSFIFGEAYPYKEIFFIESKKNYTQIYLDKQKVRIRKTLSEWEKELQLYGFVRTHKSYLVNIKKVKYIKKAIYLKNGNKIPIGRVYMQNVKSSYLDFLKKRER